MNQSEKTKVTFICEMFQTKHVLALATTAARAAFGTLLAALAGALLAFAGGSTTTTFGGLDFFKTNATKLKPKEY